MFQQQLQLVLHVFQMKNVIQSVMITRVSQDTMVIAGHQPTASIVTAWLMVQFNVKRHNVLHLNNAPRDKIATSPSQKMAVATLLIAEIAHASLSLVTPHHHHVNTMKTVLPELLTNVVAHTNVFVTLQSAVIPVLLHAQKVMKELSSIIIIVVQRPSVSTVTTPLRLSLHHQRQPHHTLQQLHTLQLHQPHMFMIQPHHTLLPRQLMEVLAIPEMVEQDTMVKSGQSANVKHVAVHQTSRLNVQRSNALNQHHVHQVKPSLVFTRSIHAVHLFAVLQTKNATAASLSNVHQSKLQHAKFMKTA